MNTASLTFQKARALASSMRTTRHYGHGSSAAHDRDLARETSEIYLLAQQTGSRLF